MILGTNGAGRGHRKSILQPPSLDRFAARPGLAPEGVVTAAKEVDLHVPLVVRLEGTNVEKGKEIMAASGLAITSADDLGDAAKKVVTAVKEAG